MEKTIKEIEKLSNIEVHRLDGTLEEITQLTDILNKINKLCKTWKK